MQYRKPHFQDKSFLDSWLPSTLPGSWNDAFWTEIYSGKHEIRVLADSADIPIGFVEYTVVDTEAEIFGIAIHPNFRRQKNGLKLMLALIEELNTLPVKTVFLEVSEKNVKARALYDKLFFYPYGVRPNYYSSSTGNLEKGNAILMKLVFSD